ncbi:MAG: trypsin-like peptidase domain-containing protein [Chloroflexota bacterium]
MSSFDEAIEEAKELVALGDLAEVLDHLDTHFSSYLKREKRKLYNELIMHKGRYVRLMQDERLNIITREQAQVDRARFSQSLLFYIDLIPAPPNREINPETTELIVAQESIAPVASDFQVIMGGNNIKNIAWMEKGLRAADSVCRILTPGGGRGTGFMIAPDRLITNSHVIPSSSVAAQSYAEFNYQEDAQGQAQQAVRYRLDGSRFWHSPQNELDYAIVGVVAEDGKPPLDKWGHLTLNTTADPVPLERISIIQHPNGALKKIVPRGDMVIRTWEHRLQYSVDTMKGSSGSPVFNDEWQVIAIHHAGGMLPVDAAGNEREVNQGILMSAIKAHAGSHWPM